MNSVPSPTSRSGKRIYLSLWDLLLAVVSPVIALYLRNALVLTNSDWNAIGQYWFSSAALTLLVFFSFRLQDGLNRNFSLQEAIDIVEAVVLIILMTCAVLFTLTRLDGIPRSTPLTHGLILGAGLIVIRTVGRMMSGGDHELPDYHSRTDNIILIGANRVATAFIQMLKAYAPRRQPVIALLDEDSAMIGRAVSGVQVLATPDELEAIIGEFAVHGVSTQRVIIAGEADFLRPATLREIENICARRNVDLSFLPRMMGLTEWAQSASIPVAQFDKGQPERRPAFSYLKRAFDIVGSLSLGILLSPLLIVASLLVVIDVGLPILFWQERVGWRGRSFLIYKFRTLGAPFDSEGNPTFAGRQPRAIGRFLRASRIDELPQLLNVLFGDMSLIGPRPLLPEDQPLNKTVRLSVRPGITGWAQINGGKLVSKEEKEKLDEWYVRNASLGLDLRIALKTLGVMLKSHLSPEENASDEAQVQGRDVGLTQNATPSNRSHLPTRSKDRTIKSRVSQRG